jgi:beta-RFAP synthase
MGFFDLNGNLGRRFGSIGVCLQAPETSLLATPATSISVQGPVSERATKIAEQLMQSMALDGGVHIQIAEAIPEHSGLGSGTQLAVAIGMAISRLYGLNLTVKDIAVLTQRGMRSGIGLGTFLHGGLIVDGGRALNSKLLNSEALDSKVPPVIAHTDFPEDWPILLVFDHSHQGVHGAQEIAAFKELPEFPAESSAILCRHVLMQALPAIAERDLKSFGKAIQALQALTGDYFAPAQGGTRYTSLLVAKVLSKLQQSGVDCFGQSSWGPTGFAVFENQAQAETLLQQLRAKFSQEPNLEFVLTKANNQPSRLEAS